MSHHDFHHHKPTHNPHKHPGKLDVILVCSNTPRYESRFRLFKKTFDEMKHDPQVRITIVELALTSRPFYLGMPSIHHHVMLRSRDELWHKENMINIGIQRLPEDWQYVAWVDADVEFLNDNWAVETIEALQHYKIVQPWSHAIDMGPNGETFKTHQSFCSIYASGKPMVINHKEYYDFPHPGYAWAATREAIDDLGGLMDFAILGSADTFMAWSLLGLGLNAVPDEATRSYKECVAIWQDRAEKYIKRNIGFVPGTLAHSWHGKKRDRRYRDRWKILIEQEFDPYTDLTKDWQGVLKFRLDTPRQVRLRDMVREYMSARNEDSVDME